MPFRLIRKLSKDDARDVIIEEHSRKAAELDRVRSYACRLETIIGELNETFSEAQLVYPWPCSLYALMDGMVRQAITVYGNLQLTERKQVIQLFGDEGDDIGRRVSDHAGLARRVRERCHQYADYSARALQRQRQYQVMTKVELQKDLESIEKQIVVYRAQVVRDDSKLRRLTNVYRETRTSFGPMRYFKLKSLIVATVEDLRNA